MTQTSAATPAQTLDQQLARINQLISGGRHQDAMAAATPLLDNPTARIPALALRALAQALAGAYDVAEQDLKQLPAPEDLRKTEILLAAGSAWFKLGAMDKALAYLRRASENPPHPLVEARLGACLLVVNRLTEALPHLEAAVRLMPDAGGAWLNLARAQLAADLPEAALTALDRAASLPDKENEIYLATRTEVLVRLERHDEAENLLRDAMGRGEASGVEALVNLLCSRDKHDEAWRLLREALDSKPEDLALLLLAAELAQVRGRYIEADRYLDKAIQLEPENPRLWIRRAMMAGRHLDTPQGRAAADKALAITEGKSGPLRAMALSAHGHVQSEEALYPQAEQSFRAALDLDATCVAALNGLGHLLMLLGRVYDATQVFEQLKQIAPVQGWSQLIQARQVPDDPAILEQMALAAQRPSLDGPVQSHFLFTLAAAWEKKKDYEKAWRFASQANQSSLTHLRYRPEVHRLHVEREMARFSRAFMDSHQGYGHPSQVPVFVLGMPRSGTTLVEQILGSHSQVFGAGELSLVSDLIQKLEAWEMKLGTRREFPECVDDMTAQESLRFAEKHLEELRAYAPEAQRIVDKLPHNFEHIGLIKLIFPNAKILHLKRDPRDVAISNYFTDYAAKFGGMGFAYDLSWIGEQLVDHQRLMQHWHQVFPGQILEVDYDALVENVDDWAARIINYLDLPWEDGVLAFQSLERAVKTASVWQVRQPVYTTSKAKWKRYEAHLAPLEAALAEIPPQPTPAPLPKLASGLFLQGMAQLDQKQPVAAEASFRAILSARPAHAAAQHFLGAALYQQGKLEEACKAMRRSLELHPMHAQWLENLAKIEAALGNKDAAQQAIERARAMDSV